MDAGHWTPVICQMQKGKRKRVCMKVCVCVKVYAGVCKGLGNCVCVRLFVQLSDRIWLWPICVWVCAWLSVCLNQVVCVCVCVSVSVCVCVCVCVSLCVFAFV